ncbi:MAG TPA: BatA and WFA domain-containing protein [Gemmatimonadaceae bacterium]|nr:BatA and WFA domain-containing protein [Gemmatimonadaceae bacterium]
MIAFLTPLYLIAAAAAAVPLLIHLMRRRIGTRVDFPAVRYLARAEREHSRKLRLRNLLLMLLRVAAVLAVVMAAGRPVVRLEGSGHAPTALAIVLDNSLSTTAIVAGRPELERLRERARAVARLSGVDDRLWLVTADGSVHGGERSAVLEAIDRVEPLAGAGSPSRALMTASALVAQGGLPEREVVLVTDAQATSWPDPLSLGDARVRAWIPGASPPANRGVVSAAAVPLRWTPRGAVRARILTPDSATYRITLDGRTLARGTAARDEEVTVRAAPAGRGWVAGSVELEPDEMLGDNARHFAAWIGPAPAVTVHPGAGEFVRTAVEALAETERVAIGGPIQIVAADAATRLPALLLAPSDPVRLGAANRALERLNVPWRFGAARRDTASVIAAGDTADGTALSSGERIRVALRYPLIARDGAVAETLATAGGTPWIVRDEGYVLVGSPLLPEATTLPIRAAFVPWLAEVVSRALAAEGTSISVNPGATVAKAAAATALELLDGSRIPITGDSVTLPARAGIYFFLRGEDRVGAVVANPEPEESELRRLDPTAFRALLRSRDAIVTTSAREHMTQVFDSAPRRSIGMPLILLAIALLLTESAIAGTRRTKIS